MNTLIPGWNNLVYNNQWIDAIKWFHKTNNFPEFKGKVCPAPCKGSCAVKLVDGPVTIKNMEYAIFDNTLEEGLITPWIPMHFSGMTVVIVGSGPVGLAVANELNQMEQKVTVFECTNHVGGLLMYGIPNMNLEKDTVDRRVNLLKEEGIEFATNVNIGKNANVNELRSRFDALVLCLGSTKPHNFPVNGRTLKGSVFCNGES